MLSGVLSEVFLGHEVVTMLQSLSGGHEEPDSLGDLVVGLVRIDFNNAVGPIVSEAICLNCAQGVQDSLIYLVGSHVGVTGLDDHLG